jgi:hypothetical protein
MFEVESRRMEDVQLIKVMVVDEVGFVIGVVGQVMERQLGTGVF